MNDLVRKFYQFALFFHFFVFMIYVLSVSTIYAIPIYFKVGKIAFSFNVNLLTLLFSVLLIFAIVIASGVGIFGSGLTDASVQLLARITAYTLIWIVGSLFTLSFLSPLEGLGTIIYVVLTLGYTLGFLQSISLGSE